MGGVVIALKGVCSLVVNFGNASGNTRVELWFGMRPTGNVLGYVILWLDAARASPVN